MTNGEKFASRLENYIFSPVEFSIQGGPNQLEEILRHLVNCSNPKGFQKYRDFKTDLRTLWDSGRPDNPEAVNKSIAPWGPKGQWCTLFWIIDEHQLSRSIQDAVERRDNWQKATDFSPATIPFLHFVHHKLHSLY